MSGIINKVKEVLHKDNTSTSSTGAHTTTTGAHTTGTHHSGTAEGVAGPHSSRAANAADPRVDSDLDGSNRHTGATQNTSSGLTGGNTYGSGTTTGGTGYTGTSTTGSTNAGPHNSNLANRLDPRVDSDLDGSNRTHAGIGTAGAGYGSTHTAHTGTGAHTGRHAGNTGNSLTGHGTTGGISNSTNAGPHNSNLANKADPRVDSDLDGKGNRHGAATGGVFGASGSHATPGSGTAQNTAGPHNSDMMNKLDPRVDADLDGSKTIGGNKTHA
jgi:hypothetical protein